MDIILTCIILHNMIIIENEQEIYTRIILMLIMIIQTMKFQPMRYLMVLVLALHTCKRDNIYIQEEFINNFKQI